MSDRRVELSASSENLLARGLAQPAAWASSCALHCPDPSPSDGWPVPSEPHSPPLERCAFLAALSHLQRGEWWRASHSALNCSSPNGAFLRDYARFLAGERRANDALHELAGPSAQVIPGPDAPVSAELDALAESLLPRSSSDGLAAFLLHSVRSKQGRLRDALSLLKQSLCLFPCNWDAWEELASSFASFRPESAPADFDSGLVASAVSHERYPPGDEPADTIDDGSAIDENDEDDDDADTDDGLPNHWLKRWYKARKAVLEGKPSAIERLRFILEHEAPGMPQVRAWLGQALFDAKELDHAEQVFEQLLEEDPYRTEGMETYSNVLYVKGKLAALSLLAHRVSQANKYTPEACVVSGNYFSSRGEHQRAAEQFKRAVRLNPRFASAWTLAGHELIEMRSPAAAVASYRRAIELSPKDYRACYGIGQTYELLGLPLHALHYYRTAARMRPEDSRMWTAVAQCLEQPVVGSTAAAAAAYRQALKHGADVMGKLAALHAERGERQLAAQYHARNLERLDQEEDGGTEQPSEEMVSAMVFLAKYAVDVGDETRAEYLCHRLQDAPGPAKQEAKALLGELHRRKRERVQQMPKQEP